MAKLYRLDMYHERFLAATRRILDGDDSTLAANDLEGVLLDDYPSDERFDELAERLALYAPGQGPPYSDATAVRSCIQPTIAALM